MTSKRKLTDEEIEALLDFIKPNPFIPPESAESIVINSKKRLRKQLVDQSVYPEVIPELKTLIEKNYRESIIDPGTSVGILCAQSIGERQTQNSVVFDTEILVKKDNKIFKQSIGEFINNEMETGSVDIGDGSFVKPVKDLQIMSISPTEKIEWKNVTELSRHPTKGNLVRIKTYSGVEITATLSHSFLRKHNDIVVPVLGGDLRIGDRVPVIKKAPFPTFHGERPFVALQYTYNTEILSDESISLNDAFGWFIGIYLSEGTMCEDDVFLKNNKNPVEFQEKLTAFTKQVGTTFQIITKEVVLFDRISIDIMYKIKSKLLCEFLVKICHHDSGNKIIPNFIHKTSKLFTASVIRGYMDFDENISHDYRNNEIRKISPNRGLLNDFKLILTYFGIFSSVKEIKVKKRDDESGLTYYELTIFGEEYIRKYIDEIGSELPERLKSLEKMLKSGNYDERLHTDVCSHIANICSKLNLTGYTRYQKLRGSISRHTLGRLIGEFREKVKQTGINIDHDLEFLIQAYTADVVWDRISKIEIIQEKDYTHRFVYDFSVEGNETFALYNGLVVHNTLNTFHKAGQGDKTVTTGVPRFQELLNATKSPRMVNCKIYFKEGNSNIQELRQTVGHNFKCLTLPDISENIEMKLNKEPEEWYEPFKILYNDRFSEHEHCVSVKFDKKMLFKYRINLAEIAERIENEWDDLHCVFSSQDKGRVDIFVDVEKVKFTEKQLVFVTDENAHEIYIEECVIPNLEKLVFFGIPGIQNIYYTRDTLTDEWYIETDGSNFKQLLGNPLVDMKRLHSNNVWDIYQTLGIEAAKRFLVMEFESLMEGINLCHVRLLVEKMTFTGGISSISRYTLRKDTCGPLSKASFEESVDHFVKAGFNGEIEKCHGVSASIICGSRANIGTGFMDLKVDINQLKNAIPVFRDKDNEGIVIEKMGNSTVGD
jgi:DNA-directed RNA polymerase subunit A"